MSATNGWLLLSNLLLFGVLVGLGLVVVSLARQIGILHERTAPLGVLKASPPLRLGEVVPPLRASDLRGLEVDLTQAALRGEPHALLFVATDCSLCRSVLAEFKAQIENPSRPLVGYLVGDGTGIDGYRAYAEDHGFDPRQFLVSQALAIQLQVRLLPFLVVIDGQGRLRVREAVQGPQALRRILDRSLLAPGDQPLSTP